MPDYNAVLQQQIEQAKRQMQQEMPGQMAGASIQPMGGFGRSLAGLKAAVSGGGQTEALTNPLTGTISYNPDALVGQNQEYINDLMTHELTHVGQSQDQPWHQRAISALRSVLPSKFAYQQDPIELEGYQAASDRAVSLGHTPQSQPNFYGLTDEKGNVKPQLGDQVLPSDKPRTPPQFWKR